MKEYPLSETGRARLARDREALTARFSDAACAVLLCTDAPYGKPVCFAGGIFQKDGAYFYADEHGRVLLSGFEALAPVSLEDAFAPLADEAALFQKPVFQRENPFLIGKTGGKYGLWALDGSALLAPLFDGLACFSPVSLTMIGARNKPRCPAKLFFARIASFKTAAPEALSYFSQEFIGMQKEKDAPACAVFDASGRLLITDAEDVLPGSFVCEDGEFGDHLGTSGIWYRDLFLRDGKYGSPLVRVMLEALFPDYGSWEKPRTPLADREGAAQFLPYLREKKEARS